MYGEHFGSTGVPFCAMGSSPHVRGALSGVFKLGGAPGIIPACTGSTPRPQRRWPSQGDHPRMYGEHLGVV